MNKIFSLFALTVIFSTIGTHAAQRGGFDGCYRLYMQNGIYPTLCLDGTTEEGINGSGVRLAIFQANTSELIKCLRSTSSGMDKTSFVFNINEKAELTLSNVVTNDGLKEGDATIGKTNLKFIEIDQSTTRRLMEIAYSSDNCF